jgi:carboxymethylenebutenolidase
VLNAYRALSARKKNVDLHIFPGVQHGYMMRGAPKAFDRQARDFSMQRALGILASLRSSGSQEFRAAS